MQVVVRDVLLEAWSAEVEHRLDGPGLEPLKAAVRRLIDSSWGQSGIENAVVEIHVSDLAALLRAAVNWESNERGTCSGKGE